jgi:hypothetical protein
VKRGAYLQIPLEFLKDISKVGVDENYTAYVQQDLFSDVDNPNIWPIQLLKRFVKLFSILDTTIIIFNSFVRIPAFILA